MDASRKRVWPHFLAAPCWINRKSGADALVGRYGRNADEGVGTTHQKSGHWPFVFIGG
jgi:hypothetical protein